MARKNENRTNEEKVAKRAPLWQPTPQNIEEVRALAELGWPNATMAGVFGIHPNAFAGAMVRIPELKAAYEQGVQDRETYKDRCSSWRPTPAQMALIEGYAEEGLLPKEICAKLGITRNAFNARMEDTPQLKDAYERGNGKFCAELNDENREVIFNPDFDRDRSRTSMLSHLNKAYRGLSERPELMEPKKVEVDQKVQVVFHAPEGVPTEQLAAFAAIEMKKAEEANKLLVAKRDEAAVAAVVDAEVTSFV